MSYVVQSTRASSLTIGGVDYTNSMVEWQVSDSSVNGNGLLETTGAVTLAQRPGQPDLSDYDRNSFTRGAEVILDMIDTDGSTFRHPRGLLYVLATSYDPESEELALEIGCRIALANLTDEIDQILPFSPETLEASRQNIQSLANALFAAGEVLYQNNQGQLVKVTFFDGDSTGGIAAGVWTSVFGQTTLSASPLSGTSIIPDIAQVSYDIPADDDDGGLVDDPAGYKYTENIEESNYFLQYPASTFERNPQNSSCALTDASGNTTEIACIENGDSPAGGVVTTPPDQEPRTTACGNTLGAPQGTYVDDAGSATGTGFSPVPVSSNFGWTTRSTPTFVSATRTATSRTEYGGPAGQVSKVLEEVRGPRVELNAQYYADVFAYCVFLYGYASNPNGSCPFVGLEDGLQNYAETFYFYGPDNELVTTVRDSYQAKLALAREFDWRSGINNGVPQDFDYSLLDDYEMVRTERVITEYLEKSDSLSVVLETTFASSASRGVGIKAGCLDALCANGIKTTIRRTSTTQGTIPDQPDTIVNAQTATKTETTQVIINKSSNVPGLFDYIGPSEAGPYIIDISLPTPVLNTDPAVREQRVQTFLDLVPRWVKGDAYGMQITEALRSEIASSWYPGMPFRYADTLNNTIVGLRMNACSWACSKDAAVVGTDGVWTGFSIGSLNAGTNIVGNSSPDMGSGSTPPPNPTPTPPSITNDVVTYDIAEVIEVDFWIEINAVSYGADGILPTLPSLDDSTFVMETSIVVFINGAVVEPGTILQTTGAGGMPIGSNGSLITSSTTIVTPNLFQAQEP